ncbi:prepilin-type N-terminal cleavage/methylation domain-containing protein [Pseudomonas sp. PDM14]|uniref:PilW family protein n=1 Tax=Pseudomonas sp. PDM14 TaxID=2769288 RepID=UPI001785CE7A|nr:prepilin-type N-terminal cleavage/methylation domain-containing protein [Pseudomonas sp. PDM14]MBD9485375.1 prepilin-type N-terminal cleavage/methylation domain-containing protein [Pseudomonas sp. PDM14]
MHKQTGISMIELMVALLISSFLILGVTQVYLDNKENYLFQQGQGNNIENARFSILIIDQQLSKTGYRRRPDETFESAFPATADCGNMSAGQTVKKVDDSSFCIRYQPAFTNAKTCDGNDINNIPTKPYLKADPVTEVFTLQDNGDSTLNLTCRGVVIATNIAAIRFEYGFNSGDEKKISEYSADPEDGRTIRAIQFSILATSTNEITKSNSSMAYKHWFGNEPTDHKLYTMLSSSSSIRNLMP